MIYNLRKKFIKICTVSFLLVFSCIFVILLIANSIQRNRMADMLTDIISENNGDFPDIESPNFHRPAALAAGSDLMNTETRFLTRFFTVTIGENHMPLETSIEFISSITDDEARQYAEKALQKDKERGWISDYRYKIYINENGLTEIVFVNGSMMKFLTNSNTISISSVFLVSSLAVLLLIIIISKKAVRPVAESYEKQKQFITDANHELKTPLTLILTNVDIAESEVGKNEWLDDIRSEGQRMSMLVNRLVVLTRMDEGNYQNDMTDFSISDSIADTVSEFSAHAEGSGKSLHDEIAEHVNYHGSESEIRQLTAILLDNAVKYCDDGGEIKVKFFAGRHPVLRVENTCHAVESLELNRLFDRFYRADKVRTSGNSFGIGLSIAKAIVEHHKGTISAQKVNHDCIAFIVKL